MAPDTDYRIAYCAGYFDGEGCIWLENSRRFNLHIKIASGDRSTLLIFSELFGGAVTAQTANHSRVPIFQWMRNGAEAIKTLSQLNPFMVAKREQSEAVLACDLVFRKRGYRYTPSSEELAVRQKLLNTLRDMRYLQRKHPQKAIEMAMAIEGCTTRAEAIRAISVSYIQDHASEMEHMEEATA